MLYEDRLAMLPVELLRASTIAAYGPHRQVEGALGGREQQGPDLP